MESSDWKQRDFGKMLTLFKNFCLLFLTIDTFLNVKKKI
jgi:hypothetical protein